ncbi:MAG TPA: hypothetical protein VK633_15265, partial [Verrucomicrobiae bacterium]|nr:hypothetical protein [Verrucomicrobiae bacterium]
MKCIHAFGVVAVALGGTVLHADDPLDRVSEALSFSTFNNQLRGRLSGLADFEGYHFDQPAPGLIATGRDSLFNPRLALFFDAQIGAHLYLFTQSRLDRGFDPSDHGLELRLDEYALRLTPWEGGRFNLQAGQFATVVGNWVERHLSWENPFITAPLPYEQLTTIYDSEAPESVSDFVRINAEERYEYNPVIWGPSYATGVSLAGRFGPMEYAAEMKNAALSSRPEAWRM